MRDIQLQSITLESFRSFRDKTTITLSDGFGLKFLSGDNQAEPRLGANGAGKSTLWDALAYCLFGASVKGVRANDLTTWGYDSLAVQTGWTIDETLVTIMRKGSPNRLTIDGQPVDQETVDRLIGLDRTRFLQSVVFGQAVPLFIDLSGPDRGGLLDQVLNLGIWLKAADAAASRSNSLDKRLKATEEEIAFYNGKLAGLANLEQVKQELDGWQAKQNMLIDQAISQVDAEEQRLAELKPAILTTKTALDALPTMANLNKQIQIHQQAKAEREAEYRAFWSKLQDAQRLVEFYQHTKVCQTCQQTISPVVMAQQIKTHDYIKQQMEMSIRGNGIQQHTITAVLERLIGDQDKLSRKRDFLVAQHATALQSYRDQQRTVDAVVASVDAMASATNPHQKRYDDMVAEIEQVRAKAEEVATTKRRLQVSIMRADFWKAGFKRVRLFMVKRVLAQLEIETASAAAALGLIGWTISYATELETKSGSVRPGIHITVASPLSSAPWEAWSGGEGQRIRLAVALGLASLIQRMAGVSIGFEVWDEPAQHLGEEGIDDLLACLKHRATIYRKSVWVCDHRALVHSAFSEIWQVSKTDAGSSMQLLTNQES